MAGISSLATMKTVLWHNPTLNNKDILKKFNSEKSSPNPKGLRITFRRRWVAAIWQSIHDGQL
jgi:hypothetical protein